jgi:hypothetical protein
MLATSVQKILQPDKYLINDRFINIQNWNLALTGWCKSERTGTKWVWRSQFILFFYSGLLPIEGQLRLKTFKWLVKAQQFCLPTNTDLLHLNF